MAEELCGLFLLLKPSQIKNSPLKVLSTCAQEKNTLDNVYSNIKHGYKVSPLPHLGKSNHISLFLTPAYRLIVSTVKPNVRHIQVWPDGACEQLRDCFNTTEWSLLQDNDINTYTSTVLFYIKCCVDKKKLMVSSFC